MVRHKKRGAAILSRRGQNNTVVTAAAAIKKKNNSTFLGVEGGGSKDEKKQENATSTVGMNETAIEDSTAVIFNETQSIENLWNSTGTLQNNGTWKENNTIVQNSENKATFENHTSMQNNENNTSLQKNENKATFENHTSLQNNENKETFDNHTSLQNHETSTADLENEIVTIRISFYVVSEADIGSDDFELLDESFQEFVSNIIDEMELKSLRGGQRQMMQQQHRRDVVIFNENSVKINVVGLCPPSITSLSFCVSIEGRYDVLVAEEYPTAVQAKYVHATQSGVNNGSLSQILADWDSDTGLIILPPTARPSLVEETTDSTSPPETAILKETERTSPPPLKPLPPDSDMQWPTTSPAPISSSSFFQHQTWIWYFMAIAIIVGCGMGACILFRWYLVHYPREGKDKSKGKENEKETDLEDSDVDCSSGNDVNANGPVISEPNVEEQERQSTTKVIQVPTFDYFVNAPLARVSEVSAIGFDDGEHDENDDDGEYDENDEGHSNGDASLFESALEYRYGDSFSNRKLPSSHDDGSGSEGKLVASDDDTSCSEGEAVYSDSSHSYGKKIHSDTSSSSYQLQNFFNDEAASESLSSFGRKVLSDDDSSDMGRSIVSSLSSSTSQY